MEQLNPDFREFIALLDQHQVEYLIVGGYAVGIHGFPRYTGDIDFFVALSAENAKKLVQVFDDFGFKEIGLQTTDFLTPDFVVEIGREPRKIQVLTGIDGVTFKNAFANRLVCPIQDLNLPFISFDDLLTNKKATGRAKDLIDCEELSRLNPKQEASD